jgi:hypothetical protein
LLKRAGRQKAATNHEEAYMATFYWLPGSRAEQLAMAKVWIEVLADKGADWNVPTAEKTALGTLTSAAEEALAKLQDKATRTHLDTVHCDEAFAALKRKMRFIKKHYFLMPPLTAEDLTSLGLKAGSNVRVNIPAPTSIPGIEAVHTGYCQITTHFRRMEGSIEASNKADYGISVRYGIVPPEAATTAENLPKSLFTRRPKKIFAFSASDIGKTVYFCIRYENAKGEPGQWSPLFSAVVA